MKTNGSVGNGQSRRESASWCASSVRYGSMWCTEVSRDVRWQVNRMVVGNKLWKLLIRAVSHKSNRKEQCNDRALDVI
jgi:hypothetical protein